MNKVSLYLGHRHAARVVRILGDGPTGFSEIRRQLASDGGPAPSASGLSKTMRALIAHKEVVKDTEGRYTLVTKDERVAKIAELACSL